MKYISLILIFWSSLALFSCGEGISGKRLRPGDVIGLQGLERPELEEITREINDSSPEVRIPSDGDYVESRIIYKNEQIREFQPEADPNIRCRFSFIEAKLVAEMTTRNTDEGLNIDKKTVETPLNPRFTNVPQIKAQEETCVKELEKLTSSRTQKNIDLAGLRQKFNQEFKNKILNALNLCDQGANLGDVRCLGAFIRRMDKVEGPVKTYSMDLEFNLLLKDGSKVFKELTVEVSPQAFYFFPSGLLNMNGEFLSVVPTIHDKYENIQLWNLNF